MRISHNGRLVTIDRLRFGPGVARNLAGVLERKAKRGEDPVLVKVGDTHIKVLAASARKMVTSLRRHAALAETVRGPVGKGPIRGDQDAMDRVDDLFAQFAQLLEPKS